MAHCIEEHDSVLSIEGTEWHGLAEKVDSIGDEEMKRFLFPLVCGKPSVETEDGQIITLEAHQTVLADIRSREGEIGWVPLHTPKKSYRPISNGEIWEMVRNSISGMNVKVTTVGTLENLKKFFISVDLGGPELKAPNGDKYMAFLNFMTSHDGTLTFETRDSMIRIVCMNTFNASRFYEGALNVSIPHTKNAAIQLNNLSDYLASVLAGREKIMESMGYLLNFVTSGDEVDSVLAGYFTEEEADEMSTRSFNRIEPIKTLFRKGKGNHGENRYDLFNAFTEYFTSGDGAGGKKASESQRLTVSQFGKAAAHKEGFLELLLDEGRYQETKSRGEKLVRDKQLAMA